MGIGKISPIVFTRQKFLKFNLFNYHLCLKCENLFLFFISPIKFPIPISKDEDKQTNWALCYLSSNEAQEGHKTGNKHPKLQITKTTT
jgi:hypothetical protein